MSEPERTVDWETLAQQLGSFRSDGEFGGSDLGRQALTLIVGADALRAAVDHYVDGRPGSQLARSVLALLRPAPAMERCLELFRSDSGVETRRTAVELLRVVADARGLGWVDEFLSDPDEGVQVWGAGLLDQLLWSEQVDPAECKALLDTMEQHPNPGVQGQAQWIRSFLDSRRESSES
jgi:hypothetical protein